MNKENLRKFKESGEKYSISKSFAQSYNRGRLLIAGILAFAYFNFVSIICKKFFLKNGSKITCYFGATFSCGTLSMAYIQVVKVHCGGVHRNRQPLAKVKGVHREVESEGRQRQNSGLRNTNHIRHIMGMSVHNNTKSKRVADKTVICKCGRYMEGKRYDLNLGKSYRGKPSNNEL